jgi:hypothetical protein
MATDIERAFWREACDMAGPARMRLRLEHRRNEFSPEHACEIESWLSDKEKELSNKDKEARPTETRRSNTIRDWTIVVAWAGVVATIGSTIVVWPVLIKSSWCAIDAQVGGIVGQYFPDDDPIKRGPLIGNPSYCRRLALTDDRWRGRVRRRSRLTALPRPDHRSAVETGSSTHR